MFEFASPWFLWFILVPPLIWFVLQPAALKLPGAIRVPFYNALSTYMDKEKSFAIRPHFLRLFFLIWALLVLALAGPRWVGNPMPLKQEGRNLMLVLDLSESMGLEDMPYQGRYVSRLAVVKNAAEEFVKARSGDRMGLILFGSRAYLQTPLTFDRQNILQRLEDATVGLAGNSTSIGDALGLAVKRLQNIPQKSRVIVLLTDGANNSGMLAPLKAAELAENDKIKVYTIGLGSETGAFLNLGMSAELDEKTLKAIADKTGGRYFRAADSQSLDSIYETINQLETISAKGKTLKPQKDYYLWPLGLAFLLFLFYAGRRWWQGTTL